MLAILGPRMEHALGGETQPAQHMFIFRASSPARSKGAVRLHFCVQDSRNSYYVLLSEDSAALRKIENGRDRELASAPFPPGSENARIEIQRKASEIVLAANGRFLCRAADTGFYGEAVAIEANPPDLLTKIERVQPLADIVFTDDFMRREEAGVWQPLGGRWEISGVQWAERSVNPFSLFCRFPDTPSLADLYEGRTRRYVGIGIRTEYQNDRAVVIYVFDKTPAWEAGIRAGDTILAINGLSAIGTSRGDLLERLKGTEGQSVAITIAREEENERKILNFNVEHKLVDLDSIEDTSIIKPAAFARQALIAAGHYFWSDYTFEASVRSLGRGEIGLISCMKDERNYLLFKWSADTSPAERGAMSVVEVSDGKALTLAAKAGGFVPDQFYRLKLAVSGTSARAYVDDRLVLQASVPDLTWGRAALYAADSLGAYFDDVRIVSREEDESPLRPARYKTAFVKDEYMADWAVENKNWEAEADKDGVVSWWHRYPFPGDARLEVQDAITPEYSLIINADRPTGTRGYRLQVNRVGKWFSLYRNAMPLAKDVPLPMQPCQAAIESHAAQGEADGRVDVIINDTYRKTYETEPLKGGNVGLVGPTRLSPSGVFVSSSKVLDYSFDEAPVDWRTKGGQWGIMNRWVCDPRWSWFGGRSAAIASVWHKCAFEGDVTLDAYVALAMPSYWKSPHERPGDLCLSICSDGESPASGYSVIVAGEENSWTRLYRRRTVVDETRSPLFLLPRREISWEAAMRLHRTWYHLRLVKRGSHISFFLNERLALEYLDPEPIEKGHVGIWTVNNTILLSRVRIAFEKMTPPEIPINDCWSFKDDSFTNIIAHEITANVDLSGTESRTYCVTNSLPGGHFALASVEEAIDLSKNRILDLEFKADPETKVDLYFDLNNAPHRIRLTGPQADDGKSIELGEFPGVAGDGQWHAASFRLYDCLKDLYPYLQSFQIRNVSFANRSNENYLLAGYGGNPKGARYWVRNVLFHDGTRDDIQAPRVTAIAMPLQDATKPNSIVLTLADDKSGVDESALRVKVNGRSFSVSDPAVNLERKSGRLDLNLPVANIALKDGMGLEIELLGLKDYAGNEAKEPYRASWRFEIAKDRFPPSNIRIHPGIEEFIHCDFERDLGDCYPVGAQHHTIPGRAGGWLRRERSDDSRETRNWYLRVQNLRMAHDFGVGFLTQPCDIARFPVLSLDYRIAPDVAVDASFEIDGDRKVVRFAAGAFRQDLRLYGNFETVGAIPRVVADAQWHSASVNLLGVLQSYDSTRTEYTIRDIHFADDVTGYLGNYEGAKFCLDNIRLHPVLSAHTLKPRWTAEDISGIADYRIAVNAEYDFTPEGKTLDADLKKLEDGFAYIHLALKDGAGNWSETVHERVFLDVTPPRVERFEPQREMAGTFAIQFVEQGGLDPKSVSVSVDGKRYEIDSKTMWYDQGAQVLTWRIGSETRKLFGGRPSVEVELLTAKDFAGNSISSPQKWVWPLPASKSD